MGTYFHVNLSGGSKYFISHFVSFLQRTALNCQCCVDFSSVTAVLSSFCFIIVTAVIVLGLGALFLLFVLLYSQMVASHLCETLRELLHDPLTFIALVRTAAPKTSMLSPGQTDRQVVASGRKLNLCRDLRWVAKRTRKFPRK